MAGSSIKSGTTQLGTGRCAYLQAESVDKASLEVKGKVAEVFCWSQYVLTYRLVSTPTILPGWWLSQNPVH